MSEEKKSKLATEIKEFSKKADLPQLETQIFVVGTIKENNVERTDFSWSSFPVLTGDIVITCETPDGVISDHKLDVFQVRPSGGGSKNHPYNKYERLENKLVQGTLVRANCSLGYNEYTNAEGELTSFNKIMLDFIEPVQRTKEPIDMCKGTVQFVCNEITDVTDDKNEPTGDLSVIGFTFDPYGGVGQKVIPLRDFVIPSDLQHIQKGLSEYYFEGKTGRVTIEIINGYKKEKLDDDFGAEEDKEEITGERVNLIRVINGQKPFKQGQEWTKEQIKDAEKIRALELEHNKLSVAQSKATSSNVGSDDDFGGGEEGIEDTFDANDSELPDF